MASTDSRLAPASSPPSGAAASSVPSLRDRIPKLEPRRRKGAAPNPLPFPETPALPAAPPPSALSASAAPAWPYAVPQRRILTPRDHELFLNSASYALVVGWVFGLAEACRGTPSPSAAVAGDGDDAALSPAVRGILEVLRQAEQLVRDTPPDGPGEGEGAGGGGGGGGGGGAENGGITNATASSRFGNKRFRDFFDEFRARLDSWHRVQLGMGSAEAYPAAAVEEASTYLLHSLGSRARIDYGSGHELNFVMWLLCLRQLGVVSLESDGAALVLRAFASYLGLMRAVQAAYYLEPAGSHGVWGLDDYQFLPFLFGASQLLGHRYITPRAAVHSRATLDDEADRWLYLDQVRHVAASKVGVSDVRWHSPMLDDISAARGWDKVEGGMRRLFVADVLRKLPVMQHFLFGSLIPAADGMSPPRANLPAGEVGGVTLEEDGDGEPVTVFTEGGVRHMHTQNGWGECCGIKVPSGIAAAEEARKRGGEVFRRIPFD